MISGFSPTGLRSKFGRKPKKLLETSISLYFQIIFGFRE